MKKTKKVSFNMIYSDMVKKDPKTVLYKGVNNEYEILVQQQLNFKDAMNFVNDIVESCFDDSMDTYRPETFDFALRVNTLVYYAGLTIPGDIAKAYSVVYGTELFNMVLAQIENHEQYEILIGAAEERVDHLQRNMISTHASSVNELLHRMDEVMEESNRAVSEFVSPDFRDKINNAMSILEYSTSNTEDENDYNEEDVVADDGIVVLQRS